MRLALAAMGMAVLAALGCNRRNSSGVYRSADTTVTQVKVPDTTIVTHDTVVRSDTIHKAGSFRPRLDSARAHHRP